MTRYAFGIVIKGILRVWPFGLCSFTDFDEEVSPPLPRVSKALQEQAWFREAKANTGKVLLTLNIIYSLFYLFNVILNC